MSDTLTKLIERVVIFMRRAGRQDAQYGAPAGMWRGRISPALAWSLAGILAERVQP